MKNIFKKVLLLSATIFCTMLASADSYTYDFTSQNSLATDWNVNNPDGTTCSIASSINSLTAKDGNFLAFSFTKSKTTVTITSKASYTDITSLSVDACATDNSKPTFTINIVDNAGKVVTTLLKDGGSKNDFNTGGTKKWGNFTKTIAATTGHIQIVLYSSSSGKYVGIDNIAVTYTAGSTPAQKSDDATLKELKYDGTSVPNFDAKTLDYSVTLPADYSGVPNVTAIANDSKATLNITPAASATGKASVLVTAEDGTTKKTYTIQFSQAAADEPVITSFVVAGVQATIDQANKTITATLPIGTSLTNLTPTVSGDNIASYTPQGAQDFTNPVQYTVTSASGKTATYTVTLQVEQPKSSDATLKTLTVGGKAITLQAGVYNYTVDAESGSAVPQVSATPNDSKATIKITQAALLTDKATVVVTAEDGSTQTYTITFNVKVPSSDLTTHTPGIYEAEKIAGGYGGTLSIFNGREYEVYYPGKDGDNNTTINLTPVQKNAGIATNKTSTSCEMPDGWLKVTHSGMSNYSYKSKVDEYATGEGTTIKLQNNNTITLHISGFDQFSFYGKDNNTTESKGKHFEVYIDGIKQPMTLASSATIRRFNITTGEHLIKIVGIGGSKNELYGFSLRVADEPRVSWIKGNDSTQNVLQTRLMTPVTYYTKYNSKGKTVLEWEGASATGISLNKGNTDGIGDTLTLSGTANCPVGTYIYKVVAYNQDNVITNSLSGKLTITSKIEATSDTIQDGFTNEAIDGFTFRYYALSDKDITLTWTNGTPAGITGSGSNGTYTISGTPTAAGVYSFTISVLGGNSITGKLTVTTFDPGNNPVLYLYKNTGAYEKDGVYLYLKSKGKNMVPRKAQSKLRSADQYAKYKWVLISEDVDANNGEIMALARGNQISMPVLNMKSFSYSESRLDWGDPDNGSINNKSIRVVQPTHPIIKAMGKKQGDAIQVIDSVVGKGLMPAAVDYQGTLCLATAATRGEEYTADGKEETFLHEVPASLRGGKKYICFPLSIQSSKRLTGEGKKLIDACVDYLLNTTATIGLPKLEIQSFTIDGNAATIYQDKDSISLVMPEGTALDSLTPSIKLSDATTHVLCKQADENGSVDFSNSNLVPIVYTVSDYINVRHYVVCVTAVQPMGIEEVYQAGEWVNIYDIQGRKVATTNENVYTMNLPKGMYIVQTTRGTIKIMR